MKDSRRDENSGPKDSILFGRIPIRIWEDPAFRDGLSRDAKLLYCFLAVTSMARPRLAGCLKASPAVIAEAIDADMSPEQVVGAATELMDGGFIFVDFAARILWAEQLYTSVKNQSWFLGRFREIANFPACDLKDRILLHAIERDRDYIPENRAAFENMYSNGLISESVAIALEVDVEAVWTDEDGGI